MRRMLVLIAVAFGLSGFTCGGSPEPDEGGVGYGRIEGDGWYQVVPPDDGACLEYACHDELVIGFAQARPIEPGTWRFELAAVNDYRVACELRIPAPAAPAADWEPDDTTAVTSWGTFSCDDRHWSGSATIVCADSSCESGKLARSISFSSFGVTPESFDVRLVGPSGVERTVTGIAPNYDLERPCHECRMAGVHISLL